MKVKKGGIHHVKVEDDLFLALDRAKRKLKLKTKADAIRHFLIDFGYLKE